MPLSVRGTSISAALRRQALKNPMAATLAIAQAVVQPVGAMLPEFDLVGMDTIPSPVYGTWRVAIGILRGDGRVPCFERRPRRNHRALPGGYCRNAASSGSRGEVGVRFGGGQLRYTAGDAHLAV